MTRASDIRDFFAEIFESLDAEPRVLNVRLKKLNATLSLEKGKVVFSVGDDVVKASFRERYIPEHPVPLEFNKPMYLSFVPTTGNRVKVRRVRRFFKWFIQY